MEKVKVDMPQMKTSLDMMKLGVLLDNYSLKDVKKFAAKWDYQSAASLILGEVYKRDDLTRETYLWTAENFGNTDKVTNPLIFDALATCYRKGHEYSKAIENQKRAIEIAKTALNEGSMFGTIMDYTITEYEAKLKKYQSLQKG